MREGRSLRAVAVVVRARGTAGELVCRPVDGLGPLLAKGMDVVVLPPTFEVERRQRVVSVVSEGNAQRVRLSGVDNATDATTLGGHVVFVDEGLLPEGALDAAGESLIGLAVVDDEEGFLGIVRRMEGGSAQRLLAVEREGAEVLIPAVEPIVRDVDGDVVHVSCPPGLLDL